MGRSSTIEDGSRQIGAVGVDGVNAEYGDGAKRHFRVRRPRVIGEPVVVVPTHVLLDRKSNV